MEILLSASELLPMIFHCWVVSALRVVTPFLSFCLPQEVGFGDMIGSDFQVPSLFVPICVTVINLLPT